jgi:hypothetical protein
VSRLWSRFGVRVLSVALLAIAVTGGVYLGRDRDSQQHAIDAGAATEAHLADQEMIKQHMLARELAAARQRAAEAEARKKAREAAERAASRAQRADEAASRKKVERESDNPGAGPTVPYTGPIPKSCGEYSGNRKIGCALMLQRGFPIKEFPCLEKLWTKESGWNHRSQNRSSGAYGIPQALPGTKMASAGSDWRTNPATQIKWGLGYVKGRYKSPCRAWGHFQSNGWY